MYKQDSCFGKVVPENQSMTMIIYAGFLFLGNVGYGTLIWVVTAELLPPKVGNQEHTFTNCVGKLRTR
jgi:hypothetical protein